MRHAIAFVLAGMLCGSSAAWAEEPPIPVSDDDFSSAGIDGDETIDARKGEQLRLYFIGNSYTAAGGGQQHLLPALLDSQGFVVKRGALIQPGETLEDHWMRNLGSMSDRRIADWEKRIENTKDDATREKLEAKYAADKEKRVSQMGVLDKTLGRAEWDVIVIQPWSGAWELDLPTFDEHVGQIVELVRRYEDNAKIVLYVPWAGGDKTLEACQSVAEKYDLLPANALLAARSLAKSNPDVSIHRSADDGHPNQTGAYLISMTLYASITGKSPIGLPTEIDIKPSYDFFKDSKNATETYTIDPVLAKTLQHTAWKTYQDTAKWARKAGIDGYAGR